MRVYICGPMSGYPEHNYPAFDAAEEVLKEQKHIVINPANLTRSFCEKHRIAVKDLTYRHVLLTDLNLMATCDAILLLPGWEGSKGAKLEYDLARLLELEILNERRNENAT